MPSAQLNRTCTSECMRPLVLSIHVVSLLEGLALGRGARITVTTPTRCTIVSHRRLGGHPSTT
eukprot:6286754-Prymnesium_polylepis.2